MKKIIKVALFAIATCSVSFSSLARFPAQGDCDAWNDLLTRCEATEDKEIYGMACQEVYNEYQNCVSGNGSC